jgi:carboxypeptidase PM20D1
MEGGHSAAPNRKTAIGVISSAITKLEKYQFDGTMVYAQPMFEYAAAEARFPMKAIYSNLWLTGGILLSIMESSPDTNGSIRTTQVATVFNAGFKDNVIPQEASSLINLRLMPGDTIKDTIHTITDIIDNDKIKIEKVGYSNEAPEASPTDTASFRIIQQSLKDVFLDCISVPYFITGGTDAKHYKNITKNIYNVTPSIKETDEEGHGVNERIPIDNYEEYIKVFIQVIKNI